MPVTCKADFTRFNAALKKIIVEHKKDAATELNRRVVQVLIGAKGYKGAVQLTKKATKVQIRKDLNTRYHVAGARGGKSGGMVKLLWILASKVITRQGGGKGLTRSAYNALVAVIADKIYEKRVQSIAYIAAGWLQCAHKLMAATPGVNFTGKQSNEVKVYPNRRAAKSYSIPAEPGSLTVSCYNMATSNGATDAIAEAGVNAGVQEQVRDMEDYLQRKLEASAKGAVRQLVGLR